MKWKNNILIASLGALLISGFAFAGFTDVNNTHKNFTAIEYLQANGILNGYSDGTFRPETEINRAEFLKIIMESADIPFDVTTPAPFSDIPSDAWYTSYIQKAYAEGWIVGYNDGTFKPGQGVTKAEALKIIAVVQNWPYQNISNQNPYSDVTNSDWFFGYINFAFQKNYLEDVSQYFLPNQKATRAQISEVIYRTLINPPATEIAPTDENFFTNVTLATALPEVFLEQEVYFVSGNTNTQETTATIILKNTSTGKSETFKGSILNSKFEIPVHFTVSGDYNIGIIAGEEGTSKAKKITVNPARLPSNSIENQELFKNLNITLKDDKTQVTFDSLPTGLKRLTLSQNSNSVSYLSRQDISSIPIQYFNFKNFNEGAVQYYLEFDENPDVKTDPLATPLTLQKSATKTFTATTNYPRTKKDTFAQSALPNFGAVNKSLTIRGQIFESFSEKAYIVKPNGNVEEVDMTINNNNITLNYTPKTTGNYLFEINDLGGIAILNYPIYVGNIVPLIPNYFDLSPRSFYKGNLDLPQARNELLGMINQFRRESGLPEVTMDEELNDLAQNHSQDMADKNYFAHINLENKSPEDRRIEAGISTPISENLAKDISLAHAHQGLIFSAVHRKNLLDPDWTKVGLGITLKDGYLLITEAFTGKQITIAELANKKQDLYMAINQVRTTNQLTTLTITPELEKSSKELNNQIIQDDVNVNDEILGNIISQNNVSGSSQAIVRIYNKWDVIKDSILSSEELNDSTWKNFGIDIQLDTNGLINTVLILNKP